MTTATTTAMDSEIGVDRQILGEMIHWIKTLNTAGVSADKAAEIARDFILSAVTSEDDDEEEYEYGEE